MSASTAKIVLKNRTLRWSTPGTLNDPYDTQFDLQVNVDRERLRELTIERMWDVFEQRRKPLPDNLLGGLLAHMGRNITGFTKVKFKEHFSSAIDEGFDAVMKTLPQVQNDVRRDMMRSKILFLTVSPTISPMWAHYADFNRGVVLRFRSIPFLDSAFGMAKPINYVSSVPNLLDEELLAEISAGCGTISPTTAIQKMVFTKGHHWFYEQEWRIFSGLGRNADALYEDIPFHDLELDGIIFGMSIVKEERAEIAELVELYSNVSMFEARKSSNSFCHEIIQSSL